MGRRWLAGRAVRARRAQEVSVVVCSPERLAPVLRIAVEAMVVPPAGGARGPADPATSSVPPA